MNETLNKKKQFLFFEHTTYVFKSWVTLISINKLKKKKFLWNMHFDTIDKNEILVFELKEHFDVYIVEYNSIEHVEIYANFVNFKDSTFVVSKDTLWKFYLRLYHCQSEVINQLANQKVIELIKDDQVVLKTIKCEMCIIFKMHLLVFKISITKVIKFFQRLHFDLIILKKIDFNKTTCVTHF
jgi:hypothetical protein